MATSGSAYAQDRVVIREDARGIPHEVELHPETASVRWVHEPELNIARFGLTTDALDKSIHSDLLRNILSIYGGLLNIAPENTMLSQAETDGEAWFVTFDQAIDGIPVWGTEIGYTIGPDGDVVALGAIAYPDINVRTTPSISKESALTIAESRFQTEVTETEHCSFFRFRRKKKQHLTLPGALDFSRLTRFMM